jgi:hypothetical protein
MDNDDPALSLITNNSQSFFLEITRQVNEYNVTYMDAVIDYCEKNGIDYSAIGKLIKSTPTLKMLIQNEGEALNFLKKSAKLPL